MHGRPRWCYLYRWGHWGLPKISQLAVDLGFHLKFTDSPLCQGTGPLKEEEILRRKRVRRGLRKWRAWPICHSVLNQPCFPPHAWAAESCGQAPLRQPCIVLNRVTCHSTFRDSAIKGCQPLNKGLRSIVNEEWVQITGAALLGCEALDITFNFSEPPFPLL